MWLYWCIYCYMLLLYATFHLAAAANKNGNAEKKVTFKNNVPFRSCVSKVNHTEHFDHRQGKRSWYGDGNV